MKVVGRGRVHASVILFMLSSGEVGTEVFAHRLGLVVLEVISQGHHKAAAAAGGKPSVVGMSSKCPLGASPKWRSELHCSHLPL